MAELMEGEDRVDTGIWVVETDAKLRRQRPRVTLEAWMEEPELQAGQSRSRGSKDQGGAGGKEEPVWSRELTDSGGATYGCVKPRRSRMVRVNEALAEELGSY